MKNIILITLIFASASCYQKADIINLPTKIHSNTTTATGLTYQFRVSGLQQLFLNISPNNSVFYFKKPAKDFTQYELSKLIVRVKSLNGNLAVRGMQIKEDDGFYFVNLRRIYNPIGNGGFEDFENYSSTIRFVSYEDRRKRFECDFIILIEDPTGVTRSNGLRVSGGFQDSI